MLGQTLRCSPFETTWERVHGCCGATQNMHLKISHAFPVLVCISKGVYLYSTPQNSLLYLPYKWYCVRIYRLVSRIAQHLCPQGVKGPVQTHKWEAWQIWKGRYRLWLEEFKNLGKAQTVKVAHLRGFAVEGKSSRVVEQQQWEMVRQGQSLEDTEVTMRCMVLAGGATVRWYGSYAVWVRVLSTAPRHTETHIWFTLTVTRIYFLTPRRK